MPVDTEEFLRGIAILADNNNMRVTLKQSTKGAAICGAICFIGTYLLSVLFYFFFFFEIFHVHNWSLHINALK